MLKTRLLTEAQAKRFKELAGMPSLNEEKPIQEEEIQGSGFGPQMSMEEQPYDVAGGLKDAYSSVSDAVGKAGKWLQDAGDKGAGASDADIAAQQSLPRPPMSGAPPQTQTMADPAQLADIDRRRRAPAFPTGDLDAPDDPMEAGRRADVLAGLEPTVGDITGGELESGLDYERAGMDPASAAGAAVDTSVMRETPKPKRYAGMSAKYLENKGYEPKWRDGKWAMIHPKKGNVEDVAASYKRGKKRGRGSDKAPETFSKPGSWTQKDLGPSYKVGSKAEKAAVRGGGQAPGEAKLAKALEGAKTKEEQQAVYAQFKKGQMKENKMQTLRFLHNNQDSIVQSLANHVLNEEKPLGSGWGGGWGADDDPQMSFASGGQSLASDDAGMPGATENPPGLAGPRGGADTPDVQKARAKQSLPGGYTEGPGGPPLGQTMADPAQLAGIDDDIARSQGATERDVAARQSLPGGFTDDPAFVDAGPPAPQTPVDATTMPMPKRMAGMSTKYLQKKGYEWDPLQGTMVHPKKGDVRDVAARYRGRNRGPSQYAPATKDVGKHGFTVQSAGKAGGDVYQRDVATGDVAADKLALARKGKLRADDPVHTDARGKKYFTGEQIDQQEQIKYAKLKKQGGAGNPYKIGRKNFRNRTEWRSAMAKLPPGRREREMAKMGARKGQNTDAKNKQLAAVNEARMRQKMLVLQEIINNRELVVDKVLHRLLKS